MALLLCSQMCPDPIEMQPRTQGPSKTALRWPESFVSCVENKGGGVVRYGGQQEVGVKLKGVGTLWGGTMEGGPGVERRPTDSSTLRVKQHISGVWKTFSVGYVQNKLQLLYTGPPFAVQGYKQW